MGALQPLEIMKTGTDDGLKLFCELPQPFRDMK